MATVWIPAQLRALTQDRKSVAAAGDTVAAIIEDLDRRFPGLRARLCGDAGLRPGLAVAVNSQISRRGLLEPVPPGAEVHFVPAIAGG